MKNLAFVAIFLIVFIAGIILTLVFLRNPSPGPTLSSPSSDKKTVVDSRASPYQAVFLDNGQVYFGRLSGFGSDRPVLRDVYYLRLTQSLQESASAKNVNEKPKVAGSTVPSTSQEMTLIKLGNELHGPVDEIMLNPGHVLFIEDLRKDSKVVLSIENFISQKK